MGLFKKKKSDFVDLSGHHVRQRERSEVVRSSAYEKENSARDSGSSYSSGGMFGIFGGADVASTASASASGSSADSYRDFSGSSEDDDRKKKLSKRILDMTERLEDLSNQIYKLQQRVEVLERKSGVGGGY